MTVIDSAWPSGSLVRVPHEGPKLDYGSTARIAFELPKEFNSLIVLRNWEKLEPERKYGVYE